MEKSYYFKNAAWVGKAERTPNTFSVLRGHFHVNTVRKVTLNILGLGFFKCYINGKCINPDTFLPLSSDYEATCDPKNEVVSGHRIYVPGFDITQFVVPGENVIAVHFGGGWYTHCSRVFGLPKAIYCIFSEDDNGGVQHFVSDQNCRIGDSYVSEYHIQRGEKHNFTLFGDCFRADFDDSAWENASLTEELDTDYFSTDCPADALICELPVKEIMKREDSIIYDCGENTTGYPVLILPADCGEVCVRFSEECLADGSLDPSHIHDQCYSVISDGTGRTVQPEFTWFCFRYMEVQGNAVPKCIKVIHADVAPSSSFECDNETLNWAYRTFMHTMLCNLHTGHPSDCPHLERAGYTGDGQLTCHAALSVLGAEKLYKKWLCDIADGQDKITGHVQNAVPYLRCGGGPGGWGSAIVEVPYQLYRHYGDASILEKYYGNMRRYIDYLEAHSEFSLVTSDKAGEWCLGDWCCPNILYPETDITYWGAQQVIIPAPYVNTYFMVKSLETMKKIAGVIGRGEDIVEYEEKIKLRKSAIQAAYFNAFDGNFIMNVQGSNSFAVDLGLGNNSTYGNMVNYYKKLGHFDTGIFGTDILIRTLFEHGDGELAVEILTNDGPQGYEHWRKYGATTFHEYWDSSRSRSHCHPMFGAPVAYFFEYLLGIRQTEDSCGYAELLISPQAISKFNRMSGSMDTPQGTVSVSYEKTDAGVKFTITIPEGCKAGFRIPDCERALHEGKNEFIVSEQ